jgi:hypothetical protein
MTLNLSLASRPNHRGNNGAVTKDHSYHRSNF